MTEAKKKRFAGFDAGGHLNLPLHKEQKGIHGEAFMQDDLARLELSQCKRHRPAQVQHALELKLFELGFQQWCVMK